MIRALLSICMILPLFLDAQNISITDAREIDADGVMVPLGQAATVEGITVGYNFRPGGVTWVVYDTTNNIGLSVFSSTTDFGYAFKPGDHVSIEGTLDQFNGLSQIAADTLFILNEGNPEPAPQSVAGLDENSESKLVTLANVTLVDPSQWQTSGSFNVDVTNGITVNQVRIDSDTDISGKGAPTGVFSITGVGGQFDSETPFLQGYQLFPRSSMDIDPYIEDGVMYTPLGIAEARKVDADGIANYLGQSVELTGAALGINFRPGGLQFALIDQDNVGIGVFSFDDDFGITDLVEGLEYTIQGSISQFNGLTQIDVETITATGVIYPPVAPQVDPQMSEDTESSLVELLGWTVTDPSQWLGDGSSFNVDITNGLGSTIMRIDADTELSTMMLPSTTMHITGIGGQFDNSVPHLEGYQILPRYASDLQPASSVYDLLAKYEINVFPNPTSDFVSVQTNEPISQINVLNMSGKLIRSSNSNEVNLGDLSEGTYLLRFTIDDNEINVPIVKF